MSTLPVPPALPAPATPTPVPALPAVARPPRRGLPLWAKIGLSIIGLGLVFVMLQVNEGARGLLGLSIAGIIFALTMRTPAVGFAGMLVYLCVVGEVRRFLIPLYGYSGTDPLLLVSGLTVILVLGATRRSPKRSPLSRYVTMLAGLMALEVVNPLQGGLVVGLSGLLFYLVPLLWYFAAERLASPAVVGKVMRTLVGVAVAAGLYGAWQTAFGFNEAEKQWLSVTKKVYGALNVGGTTRAFSFFTSASEYVQFLVLGIVVLWVLFLRGRKAAVLLIPFLLIMMFLESERGSVVTLLATVAVLWAVQGRTTASWVPRGAVAAGIGVLALVSGLTHLQGVSFGASTQGLVNHQVQGLLNPFDANKSTAGAHGAMVLNGVYAAVRNPVGFGLGYTTIAGQKFGAEGGSTEIDFSNMFESLGLLGGVLYVFIMYTVLRRALDFWHRTRSTTALLVLGVLVAATGKWLSGGHYAASMLIWGCIGVLDRVWPAVLKDVVQKRSAPFAALHRAQERVS